MIHLHTNYSQRVFTHQNYIPGGVKKVETIERKRKIGRLGALMTSVFLKTGVVTKDVKQCIQLYFRETVMVLWERGNWVLQVFRQSVFDTQNIRFFKEMNS